jgi:hypothetical protein
MAAMFATEMFVRSACACQIMRMNHGHSAYAGTECATHRCRGTVFRDRPCTRPASNRALIRREAR